MIALRFLSQLADSGATQSWAQSHCGTGRVALELLGAASSPHPSLTHAGAPGLCLLICETDRGTAERAE